MSELAMRIETLAGNYTNAASENSPVYDVTVVVGCIEKGYFDLETLRDRSGLHVNKGAAIKIQQYAHGIPVTGDIEGQFVIGNVEEGMFLDYPVISAEVPKAVTDLVNNRRGNEVRSFIGRSTVESVIAVLEGLKETSPRASYVSNIARLAINYGQRSIQEETEYNGVRNQR